MYICMNVHIECPVAEATSTNHGSYKGYVLLEDLERYVGTRNVKGFQLCENAGGLGPPRLMHGN